MQEPETTFAEHLCAEAFELLGCGEQLYLLRLAHERIDDVGLSPLRQLFVDEGVYGVPGIGRPQLGSDRLSTRRQLVEHTEVEIPIEGHRKRSRDRRRGHDEHIRTEPLPLG